ncbi:MAG: hypothetical protein WC860_00980 [Candidatus Margulisiibacteriota bacterium]|jgi:hypothetical protein
MIKKQGILLLFIFLLLILIPSCAGNNAIPDNGNTYKISGAISNLSTSGLRTASFNPSDYMIWFQNRGSKKVYFAEINADGTFEVNVKTLSQTLGDNFIAVLVKQNNKDGTQVCDLEFAGTIIFNQGATAANASTGMKINANVSNLTIEYNPNLYKALIETSPSGVTPDATILTRLDASGKPAGANNVGKGDESKTSDTNSKNTIDVDQDGLPDVFDAMNDGSNLDNTLEKTKYDSLAGSEKIDHAAMFMSLKIAAENASTYTVTENASIVLEVVPKTSGTISSVVAHKLHSNFKGCIFDKLPSSMTSSTYPAENTKWSSVGYQLYKVNDSAGQERWTAIMWPKNNSFAPGNLVLLKVTFTDGSVEYYWLTINFKFKSIATNINSWTLGGKGSRSEPYVIPNTGDFTFIWQAPKDESGNNLTGLNYHFELFYYDFTTFPEILIANTQIPIGADLYSGILTTTQIDLYSSANPSANVIQVDTTNTYPFGDNSSINICIKRQNWR